MSDNKEHKQRNDSSLSVVALMARLATFDPLDLISFLTLLLLNMTCPVLANSVDPDQLASEEANWSGAALFVTKYVNFYQKPGSSNLIGWKLEVGVASFYSAWQGLYSGLS